MLTIIPHLWFDREAVAAARFYTSIFDNSRVTSVSTIKDTPSGDCDIVSFEVRGMAIQAISAGPLFRFTPAISFMVNFDPSREPDPELALRSAWEKLADGGTVLMPLQEYPFSKLYGWIQDRYGLSWQLILTNPDGAPRPPIVPTLLFVGDRCGQAEAARQLYLETFEDAEPGVLIRYGPGQEPNKDGTVMFSDYRLLDRWFVAMDGAGPHAFQFNEAISFMVRCDTQAEIDAYWQKLSAVPEAERCGWLKDRFGVSWQIVPTAMEEMMGSGDAAAKERVTKVFLQMKKFDLEALRLAFKGA